MSKEFAVFILSHGRADNVITMGTLRKAGYTGDVYIIIDNEDESADAYYEKFGRDHVIMFDKAVVGREFDLYDHNLSLSRKTITFARNACFQIARDLGIRYFLQLDDDYIYFQFRFGTDLKPTTIDVTNLDGLFDAMLEFYKSIPALSIAFSQGGDLIGGAESSTTKTLHLKRKVMNSFFCSVDRPFTFVARMDEDVSTYTTLGNRGGLFFTVFNATVGQRQTQTQQGGSTEMYKDSGTYVKSFYPVMSCPSFIQIDVMHSGNNRIHRSVKWKNAVPVMLGEQYRKPDESEQSLDLFTVIKPKSPAHGLQFDLRPDTSDRQVVKEVIEQNAYQRRDFKIEAGETWLDLGANIGVFTCLAARCGAIVRAYEPEPENVGYLRKNLLLNGIDAAVYQQAVISDNQPADPLKLYISTAYGKWGHSLYKPKRKEYVEVETIHMSDLLKGVDAIKMDIEGAEIPILSTIAGFEQVQKLVFEWHFDISPGVPFFLETIEHLRQFFPNIIHRKFKDGAQTLKVFPTGAIVFCWK